MNKGIHPTIGFSDTYVSLIHVKDLVRGIILAGEHKKSVGATYFISSERFYNWKEVGGLTAKIMNKRAIQIRVPVFLVYGVSIFAEIGAFFTRKPALLNIEKARDLVQRAWTCSIEKAKKELGYREELTIEEGIRDTIKWYRENGWL
jgi:nucleoside-diphosphate-sugar epimerase